MKNKRFLILSSLILPFLLGSCDSIFDSLFPHSSSVSSPIPVVSGSIMNPTTLYGGYYSSLSTWRNGNDLIDKLHDIISGGTYQPIQYTGSRTNWMSNQDADVDIYDREYLDCIYTADKVDPSNTNTSWQREHAWPASLMTGKQTGDAVKTLGRATDFHNLFASATSGNTSRGNKNYGNANKSSSNFTDRNYANGGYRYDENNFEPAEKDKGRVSRAIFYMATMYSEDEYDNSGALLYKGLKVQEEYVNFSSSTAYTAYAIGNLSDLLEWSRVAVDLLEYQHNESVYSYVPETHSTAANNHAQGNRNPYVDFPGLVEYAFGSKKDSSGSLSDLMSSYQSLNIGNPENNVRTIVSAKRSYELGTKFSKNDVVIGKYGSNMEITRDTNFSFEGIGDGQRLNEAGVKTITVKTQNNSLTYSIEVKASDPFTSGTYHYTLTGKASGGDLSAIASKPGIDNEVNLGGVTWIIRYEKGAIGNRNSDLGVTFGTSTTPVQTLTIRSKSPFSYSNKSLVESIHLKGSAASGCSYTCSLYVGGNFLKQSALGYTSGTPQVISASLTPVAGEVKFVISNITKAVYVHSLAVNLK